MSFENLNLEHLSELHSILQRIDEDRVSDWDRIYQIINDYPKESQEFIRMYFPIIYSMRLLKYFDLKLGSPKMFGRIKLMPQIIQLAPEFEEFEIVKLRDNKNDEESGDYYEVHRVSFRFDAQFYSLEIQSYPKRMILTSKVPINGLEINSKTVHRMIPVNVLGYFVNERFTYNGVKELVSMVYRMMSLNDIVFNHAHYLFNLEFLVNYDLAEKRSKRKYYGYELNNLVLKYWSLAVKIVEDKFGFKMTINEFHHTMENLGKDYFRKLKIENN